MSAIGISLANTLVLAISSALGSLLPIVLLAPHNLLKPAGLKILGAVAVELVGIALCGWAGRLREKAAGAGEERGGMVGHARPIGVALLMAAGAGHAVGGIQHRVFFGPAHCRPRACVGFEPIFPARTLSGGS